MPIVADFPGGGSGFEKLTNKVTNITAESTHEQYPSAKAVFKLATGIAGLPDPDTLENMSWDDISAISQASAGASYFEIGDTKSTLLNGTIGTKSINKTLYVYIIGFNHNSALEGKGIHFGTFKDAQTDGDDICLIDDNYGSYASDGSKWFNLNHCGNASASPYNTNYGGWKGCDARYDILGSTNKAPSGYGSTPTTDRVGYDAEATTATSPVANTLMSCLPSELRAVMKPITKYTGNKGNSDNTAEGVTASVDYLPLLAEYEIFGSRTRANIYEKDKQEQYAYYAAGNSKVKYDDVEGSTARWWGRSPRYGNASIFCAVHTGGSAGYNASRYSLGVAPAFMV